VNHLRNVLSRRALAATAVLASVCVVPGILAWNEWAAPRVIIAADTVVGYGFRPFRLDARATRSDGRTAAHARLRFVGRSSAGTVSDDGIARCTGSGAIPTTIRAALATTKIVVLCRPLGWIRGLMPMIGWGTPSDAPLYVGGPARRLEVTAYDIDGVPVERFSARESVRDSSVARLDHGFVYPVGQGRTTIDLDLDGLAETVAVEVDERIVADSVRLSAGETRGWYLGPGWYEVWLEDDHAGLTTSDLSLMVPNANCIHARESTRFPCPLSPISDNIQLRHPTTLQRAHVGFQRRIRYSGRTMSYFCPLRPALLEQEVGGSPPVSSGSTPLAATDERLRDAGLLFWCRQRGHSRKLRAACEPCGPRQGRQLAANGSGARAPLARSQTIITPSPKAPSGCVKCTTGCT
jgi:hypothetical protein